MVNTMSECLCVHRDGPPSPCKPSAASMPDPDSAPMPLCHGCSCHKGPMPGHNEPCCSTITYTWAF
jgi:hypothetical protein